MINRNSITRRDLARVLGGTAAAHLLSTSAQAAWTPNDKQKTGMIVRSSRQENLEMPLEGFLDEFTPVEHFFTRHHHYPAKVDISKWSLQISGAVSKPQKLTLEMLQKMPKIEMPAVLECAGNGRGFYEPSMPGLQWGHGAVGNAKWAGVRLADVLKLVGADDSAVDLVFDGADVPVGTMPEFLRAIPVKKGFDPDVILAYEMNGQPLPTLHGFPLRLIVPGWAGDCWVKWLTKIDVSKKEYDGFFMKTAYRHPGKPVKPGIAVDPAAMSPVQQLQPKSVIAWPLDGAEVEVNKVVNLRGVGWGGGGHQLRTLQVSLNGGQSWNDTQLGGAANDHVWRTWQYSFIPKTEGYIRVMVRGGNDSGILQPLIPSWNPSGYLWNAVQTIGFTAVANPKTDSAPAPSAGAAKAPAPTDMRKVCGVCHEDDVIKQQRLSAGQWDKEVDKMGRWGAKFQPSEKEAIVEYLAKEYPYRMR